MPRLSNVLTLAVASAALALPASALASSQSVIQDCAKDGKLDHQYSKSELRKAKKSLPADVNEYTDCRDVISQALVGGSGGGGATSSGGLGSGGGTNGAGPVATPSDVKALDDATKQARSGEAPSLSVAGKPVEPGKGGVFKTASAANGMPGSMLAALIAVALLSTGGGLVALRRRIPVLESIAARLPNVRLPNVRSAAARIFRR
jgi:hypothetical protein